MTFLDTNIWIELLAVGNPGTDSERRQAQESDKLFRALLSQEEKILTCREQLLEVINAIVKVKMREVSKRRKENASLGIGKLKEFRELKEFDEAQELCRTVVEDISHFATLIDIGNYDLDYIKTIIDRLKLADINDCIYYDYCRKNGIDLYSFDADLKKLGIHEKLHILS